MPCMNLDRTGPSHGPHACVSNAPNGNAFMRFFGSKSAYSIRSPCRSFSPLTVYTADCSGPSHGPHASVSNAPHGESIRSPSRSLMSPLTVCIASYSIPWYRGLPCLLVVVTTQVRGAIRGNATATALPSSGCLLFIFFGDESRIRTWERTLQPPVWIRARWAS